MPELVTTQRSMAYTVIPAYAFTNTDRATLQAAIEQSVVGEFAQMPEVVAIYAEDVSFSVFVTGGQYDSALMDQLLDREIKLLDTWHPTHLDFRYIPALFVRPAEHVNRTAKQIYGGGFNPQ